MNSNAFPYDVFLSHSAKDKAVERPLAERLRQDGLKVPSKFGFRNSEFGFAQPGMSAHAFGSDWAQLEAGKFRFRDPLNQERRFIPRRLDDACPNGALASSPRLAPRAYLGFPAPIWDNPNGVVAAARRIAEPQPRWGC